MGLRTTEAQQPARPRSSDQRLSHILTCNERNFNFLAGLCS